MINKKDKRATRKVRHYRIRKTLSGTTECPRLAVFRSNKHISCQIIDDTTHSTLCAASTYEKDAVQGNNIEAAKAVGKAIAERALAKNITKVVFDRGGFLFHGRVKALADAAREAGLKF